jgi:hypothetical protein
LSEWCVRSVLVDRVVGPFGLVVLPTEIDVAHMVGLLVDSVADLRVWRWFIRLEQN